MQLSMANNHQRKPDFQHHANNCMHTQNVWALAVFSSNVRVLNAIPCICQTQPRGIRAKLSQCYLHGQ
jgi:hypothetical protein